MTTIVSSPVPLALLLLNQPLRLTNPGQELIFTNEQKGMLMSRRTKPKRIINFLGAFLLETIAVAMFLFLFLQARAERQKSSHLERGRFPFIQEITQQLNVSGIERWSCLSKTQ
ncbi:MAG: hypothetical protein P8R31_15840 [Mariniblastus sp.]|nr:hypothetical protein [Mariniblastus sp.]